MGTSIPKRANELMSTKSSPVKTYRLSPEELEAERTRLALLTKDQIVTKVKKPIELISRKQAKERRDSGKIPSSRKKLS
ncbi:hypothetical protein [Brevibacillus laterosporus]|uniref:Uncharacterized protein n=1 Tax=Brevibacillus laterosporus TaxID=1465 RepID=A0AAP3DDZ3_BRELA|nr:hypothetical protein [Brevibacillus laterosporus]MCR8979489.1 hypothetical protein [Brevibacillus laterosporus]MCZ0806644.1 hypothetical protein [Brevibacillus laterosporus]MCZ0825092.1 hypothetical protein [Brevibacillus laterosporus]MCZ0852070.1 hypothetical protein [Brevibacillus laterosporus]